ncbi:YbaN family protein [Urinicoccus massiliensis]|uniref:YbaN family protein n=1 Tax=Urinicoccus massiliensis TaxID=1723382 RepID=UPI000930A34A|nr:YbaN family protein [Urinicoccus massiliensis]
MKPIFVCLGFIFMGLGILGVYLPLLPATPFFLLAAGCFSKGSKKFDQWFKSTNLYKKNIEPLKNKEGFTRKKKIKILAMVTFFLGISFYFVNHFHARLALILVLIFHYVYFLFCVKTRTEEEYV